MTAFPPDFSGTWQLDLKASGLPELLLDMQGIGWIERRAGRMMPVTQIILQSPDSLDITNSTPIATRQEQILLNGEPQTKVTKRIGEVVICSYWEGTIQITRSEMNTPKGAVTVIGRRRLELDQQTMVIELEVTTEDGRQQISERVFRRVVEKT